MPLKETSDVTYIEAVEDFSGVAFWTSDQLVDARESRIKQDYKDKIL